MPKAKDGDERKDLSPVAPQVGELPRENSQEGKKEGDN